jgi:hypothetical protein
VRIHYIRNVPTRVRFWLEEEFESEGLPCRGINCEPHTCCENKNRSNSSLCAHIFPPVCKQFRDNQLYVHQRHKTIRVEIRASKE